MAIGTRLLALASYFIVLPYLSRIGGGVDWVAQYLPPPDRMLFGILFFAAFSAIPGVVLTALSTTSKTGSKLSLGLALLAMTLLTIYFHYDYDLAADAQAAIWLVIAPFYVAAGGTLTFIVVALTAWLWRLFPAGSPGKDG